MSGLGTIAERVSAAAPHPLVAVLLTPEGFAMLASALDSAGLPTDDISAPGRCFYRFEAPSGAVLGYGGFEIYGVDVLLRSIVVLPQFRGTGTGCRVVNALIEIAREKGARKAYLLTTSAMGFFESLGFNRIERSEAPSSILNSEQAKTVCPSSAALFIKNLETWPSERGPQ
jgi:N-acetylglutamate synthase-like GNAT family acetyltransferase